MANRVDARTLKAWLSDEGEIALLDVREIGQYGERHLFFAVPLPYSRLELDLPRLVPNPATRLVICDEADGVADRAAARAEAMGYRNVQVLSGGVGGWSRAGYTLYAGVNVPSKTFGELIEHARHTPRITASDLVALRQSGADLVIVDGRPFEEFQRMSIPGAICCPNGELALRITDIAPDPRTTIVVNCAGRTRSIIGAQTLIDCGVPNPVLALENGTQGWFLAGLQLEHGASRRYAPLAGATDIDSSRARARRLASARGVAFVTPEQVDRWRADLTRTTYLLDVRSAEECAANAVAGFVHAPGGQLVQATDQWIGTRGARIVLLDDEEVRAPVIAQWLRQLGHDACVLTGGVGAAARLDRSTVPPVTYRADEPPLMTAAELAQGLRDHCVQLVDLRLGMSYRKAHIDGALWSIRPRLLSVLTDRSSTVTLIADRPGIAALAAIDLREAGFRDVRLLAGGHEAAQAAGLPVRASPDTPSDADCIDFVFFTHRRHEGDPEAARQYLAWETGLIGQLDAQERAAFSLAPD